MEEITAGTRLLRERERGDSIVTTKLRSSVCVCVRVCHVLTTNIQTEQTSDISLSLAALIKPICEAGRHFASTNKHKQTKSFQRDKGADEAGQVGGAGVTCRLSQADLREPALRPVYL